MNITERASQLYDGGWRKEDKYELVTEFRLTGAEAEKLADELGEIQSKNSETHIVYRGIVRDRMGDLRMRRTKWYPTYQDAHEMACILRKLWFADERGEIEIVATEFEGGRKK